MLNKYLITTGDVNFHIQNKIILKFLTPALKTNINIQVKVIKTQKEGI